MRALQVLAQFVSMKAGLRSHSSLDAKASQVTNNLQARIRARARNIEIQCSFSRVSPLGCVWEKRKEMTVFFLVSGAVPQEVRYTPQSDRRQEKEK